MEENGKNEKHAGGRPPIWTNPEVVQKMIDEYFKREKMPTMAGLAVSIGVSRATLYNYAEKDEFLDTIKNARERMEEVYEQLLLYGDKPTGVIFALKNTGWTDSQSIDHTTKGKELPTPILGGNGISTNNSDQEAPTVK